jgi:acyl-CoA thioesterase II
LTPDWTEAELLRLMDVQRAGDGRYVAPAHGEAERNVVEAGQLLGDAVVAAAKEVPDLRVQSATMVFSRIVRHDLPVEVHLRLPHRGRTYATAEVRLLQGDQRCSGVVLLGRDDPDVVSTVEPPPDVPSPDEVPRFDREGMQVDGRELRIVDDAYSLDPDRVGPPELAVWTRYDAAPAAPYLHAALMTQSLTHWTIVAALRPHAGYSEAMAHRELSTGISAATVAFHDDVDVTRWLLSTTRVIYTGRGMTHSEGRVHTEDGGLVASCTVQGMIRPMPATTGGGPAL